MAEIIPSDSKYLPLTQQKYSCVPTCIQMVMLRHNIPLMPAELIGYELGLVVPQMDAKLFWKPRTGARPAAGYGTQLSKKEYGPNLVFRKLGIPLAMNWSLVNSFRSLESFKEYLGKFENSQKDILLCFDWGDLHGDRTYHNGHVCLLDKVEGDQIRIVDPDPFSPKWQTWSQEEMLSAMRYHGVDKMAGCWEITDLSGK